MCTFRWGCQHKDEAVKCYIDTAQKHHDGLEVSKAGFFIDVERPYIGASPDRILDCKCCGRGVLEVKCPFCHKAELPEEEDKNFCMTKESGQWTLRRQHPYYYQVQLQMHVCRVSYADFIVWMESEYALQPAMNLSLPKWRPLQDFLLMECCLKLLASGIPESQ